MTNTLSRHWPEYLMEAASLGIFIISASLVTVILEHPASPIRQVIPDPLFRRFVIGVAMGLTAITIIYSPWVSNRERMLIQRWRSPSSDLVRFTGQTHLNSLLEYSSYIQLHPTLCPD